MKSSSFRSHVLLLAFVLIAGFTSFSQQPLNSYIRRAMQSNIVLKEKQVSLQKSLLHLKEARSLFLPSASFEGSYTLASGGREIQIPVGDLLNPVYQTLNQLTSSTKFPTIQNVSEQFLPNNFYDTRLKTSMPIINTDIRINREIKQQEVQLRQNEIDIYKKELVKDLKTAYYQYLMATEAVSVYENALIVVNQNVRVNQSLLDNGKGLPAYVSRAQSEARTVESQLEAARNDRTNALAYLNFLSNQPLDSPVEVQLIESADSLLQTINLTEISIQTREELRTLRLASGINENVQRMNRAFRTPKVNAFADIGSQGFNFKVNDQSLFVLAGVQLTMPIFQGGRNLNKIEQSKLDAQTLKLQDEQLRQQLSMAATISRNNVLSIYSNYKSSLHRLESSRQYFKLIDRGFKEGVNSFIEFLDARNQHTSSQIQVNINKYKLATAIAEYERNTSSLNTDKL